jgi:outer membrane protein insertion porin family
MTGMTEAGRAREAGGTRGRQARQLSRALLLASAVLAVVPGPSVFVASAQTLPAPAGVIRSIEVVGNVRLEPETVRSYIDLRVGDRYDREALDRALKDLFETELFTGATQIRDDGDGNIVIEVAENPVINRVVIEGSRRIKDDKIREEIKIAPRQIFTRSRARADVARILELYRRSGRFAAQVEPKIVELEQNRVDVIFEINEGPKSRIRQVNIIGNERFSDNKLRGEMATRQARPLRLFTSRDVYDPDRLAFDQQKLRQFYLTEGFADFRVVSSTAELTPDRRDFIVTFVIEEGERYQFGEIDLVSQLRDVDADAFKNLLRIREGDWYNAKAVEDTIEGLTETVGLLGYAFADVRPNFDRDRENLKMNLTFVINETPRVYVERVDIQGNTRTKDQVIRREFRLAEGDAFNSFKVRRSRDRIQSLGFFQEKLEVKQQPGTAPDKVVLSVDVEERPTGSLQLSAGFSSLERFIFAFNIEERNFRGMGQQLRLGVNVSSFSRSAEAGFLEPYLFGRNIAFGIDIFRRDFNSFRFGLDGARETTYEQLTTGFGLRTGFPLTEFWSLQTRYGFNIDDVTLDPDLFFSPNPITGELECDPLRAGRFLCDALGRRTTSSLGYSLIFDNLDNRLRPSRGRRMVLSQDFAGLGGNVKYVRTRGNIDFFFRLPRGFILNLGGEAGNITPWGGTEVNLTDRFFLGEPRFRGFGIRGVGPRVIRKPRNIDEEPFGPVNEDRNTWVDDAIGGQNYYLGRAEVEIPLGAGARELGLRPSAFVDIGALWKVRRPQLLNEPTRQEEICTPVPDEDPICQTITIPGFQEFFLGNSASPRISIGVGVSWNSPFGPFRFDVARVLRKVEGDDTQVFQFNIGTQF